MPSPFYLAGSWERSGQPLPVTCPYDNSLVGTTWLAGEDEFERATKAAVDAAPVMRKLPAYERAAILMRAHAELVARREEIGRTIAGRPNRLQVRLDILNLTNLLNKSWGLSQSFVNLRPLNYQSIDAVTGAPIYKFATVGTNLLTTSYQKNVSTADVWRLQLGVRYMFNE